MLALSWDGLRTTTSATQLRCHPQTVRKRIARFNAAGVNGLGDRPGGGRTRRMTAAERSSVLALVAQAPPGRLGRQGDGTLAAQEQAGAAHWTLAARSAAAQARGSRIGRSQIRRMFQAAGVRWRPPHPWATRADPEFGPQAWRSLRTIPSRL